jgi:hypothetical protein
MEKGQPHTCRSQGFGSNPPVCVSEPYQMLRLPGPTRQFCALQGKMLSSKWLASKLPLQEMHTYQEQGQPEKLLLGRTCQSGRACLSSDRSSLMSFA